MQTSIPLTQELVLIGGGHTHALVLKKWGMKPLPGVRVTVINPNPTAPYTGMLPGFVAGHYKRDELDIDLVKLARFAGARLLLDKVIAIDPATKTVLLMSGRMLEYDTLSIDIGITTGIPEFSSHNIPAKPLDQFADRWSAFIDGKNAKSSNNNVAIIGGGIGGIELAMAMQHALQTKGVKDASISIIDRGEILSNTPRNTRGTINKILNNNNIKSIEHRNINQINETNISLDNGDEVPSDFTVTVVDARPYGWLNNCALDMHEGFVAVDSTLKSTNQAGVFAVGDCAHMVNSPRPKAGVFAVRQAPILYDNLVANLSGGQIRKFRPQRDYLKLVSLGRKSALANKWGVNLHGPALWRWKNRIDQKFMTQFRDLKPMQLPTIPPTVAIGVHEALGDKPLCGACGAKVGGKTLQDALKTLPEPMNDQLVSRPGDDAAITKRADGMYEVITTDHLREFTADPALMARITAIHALGDIWAMGAKPQLALTTLILPRISPNLQRIYLKEITIAASDVFIAAGADIAGGHTSIGSELTIGFTVTGTTKAPITLSGARDGDVLILTKPIGVGTILAAEMEMKANGDWVKSALESMATPQSEAAEILTIANAMTDVTGFGLAGHLKGLATASGLGVHLNLDNIPTLDGALELSAAGLRSSIFNDNRALTPEIANSNDPIINLLFDPQTAGGLLAAVSPRIAEKTLAKLQKYHPQAAIIGHCRKGPATLQFET